jgi:Transposase, Mutator family
VTYCKARVDHRVVSQAVVVVTGVATDVHREVLGIEVGDGEDGGTRRFNRATVLPDPDIVDQHVDGEPHTAGRVSSYPADREVQDHAHRDP